MATNNEQKKLSPEEEAKALGKKIVMLLQSANLPEDVQISIIQTIPDMSIEQIDELINMLNEYILRGADADENLKNKFMAIKDSYEKKQANTNKSVMDELEDLEKQI